MGDTSDDHSKTDFGEALRDFAARHGPKGRGAQVWLVEKSRKTPGQISRWWNGTEVPGDLAFEEFVRQLGPDDYWRNFLTAAWKRDRAKQAEQRSEARRARAVTPETIGEIMTDEAIQAMSVMTPLSKEEQDEARDLIVTMVRQGWATSVAAARAAISGDLETIALAQRIRELGPKGILALQVAIDTVAKMADAPPPVATPSPYEQTLARFDAATLGKTPKRDVKPIPYTETRPKPKQAEPYKGPRADVVPYDETRKKPKPPPATPEHGGPTEEVA